APARIPRRPPRPDAPARDAPPSRPGLVRPRTERPHRAHGTARRARYARAPAVRLEEMRGSCPRGLGQDVGELIVDSVGIVGFGQAQALAHAKNVRVDSNGLLPEGIPEEHVGRLETDARQRGERHTVARYLAVVVGHERLGHPDDRARLGAIEPGRANLWLQ